MAIGVYRIYVSHAWGDGAALARLVAALDAVAAFLYRIVRVLPVDLAAAASLDYDLSGTVRVAMTQSHVMLIPVGLVAADRTDDKIGGIEKELARTGFRRRIPILGVASSVATGSLRENGPEAQGCDSVVTLDAATLACTIQELAEAAAAERRQANVITLARPLKDMAQKDMVPRQPEQRLPPSAAPVAKLSGSEPRPLPVAEILEAYRRHIGTRQIKPSV